DKDPSVRKEVVEALSAIGPAAKTAVPALQTILTGDSQPDVRDAAAEAITRIVPGAGQEEEEEEEAEDEKASGGREPPVEPVIAGNKLSNWIKMLKDPNSRKRGQAVTALLQA